MIIELSSMDLHRNVAKLRLFVERSTEIARGPRDGSDYQNYLLPGRRRGRNNLDEMK